MKYVIWIRRHWNTSCGVIIELKDWLGTMGEDVPIQSPVEEFCLLGYNAVYSGENKPTFRRETSPPSSGSNSKPSKKPELYLLPASCLHVIISQTTWLFIVTAVRTSNSTQSIEWFLYSETTCGLPFMTSPLLLSNEGIVISTRCFLLMLD
jgi:hypothetical protein